MIASELVIYTLILLLSFNVLGLVVSFLPFLFKSLHKYRIQNKRPDAQVFYKRLPLIGINVVSLALISSLGLYGLFPLFDASMKFDVLTILWQVMVVLLIDDLWFYFLHRWMHRNKKMLKMVHSIHHRAFSPLALEYIYVHPAEWLLGYIGPFVGMMLVASISPISIWGFWIYQAIRNLHEIDVHSGFRSLFSQWIPFWGENEHHDLHHEKLDGNYATTFTHWDYIFKTKMKKPDRKK
ncbi:MAG: sterol desaturase family protein [Flavobacteriales bacterium]|nr:sterol desaturase family protein [Flavobacteriales bacterium]